MAFPTPYGPRSLSIRDFRLLASFSSLARLGLSDGSRLFFFLRSFSSADELLRAAGRNLTLSLEVDFLLLFFSIDPELDLFLAFLALSPLTTTSLRRGERGIAPFFLRSGSRETSRFSRARFSPTALSFAAWLSRPSSSSSGKSSLKLIASSSPTACLPRLALRPQNQPSPHRSATRAHSRFRKSFTSSKRTTSVWKAKVSSESTALQDPTGALPMCTKNSRLCVDPSPLVILSVQALVLHCCESGRHPASMSLLAPR